MHCVVLTDYTSSLLGDSFTNARVSNDRDKSVLSISGGYFHWTVVGIILLT